MKRRPPYSMEICPPAGTTNNRILMACRIARRYTHRLPTWRELQSEFGMDRATAYRWLSALKLAQKAA